MEVPLSPCHLFRLFSNICPALMGFRVGIILYYLKMVMQQQWSVLKYPRLQRFNIALWQPRLPIDHHSFSFDQNISDNLVNSIHMIHNESLSLFSLNISLDSNLGMNVYTVATLSQKGVILIGIYICWGWESLKNPRSNPRHFCTVFFPFTPNREFDFTSTISGIFYQSCCILAKYH